MLPEEPKEQQVEKKEPAEEDKAKEQTEAQPLTIVSCKLCNEENLQPSVFYTWQRQALETTAIIGWNFRSTWFQRRAGLTTLSATTAGGSQSVTAVDVPEPDAVAVSANSVPGLVDQFLASG